MRVDARRGASHSSSLEAAPSQTASFFDTQTQTLTEILGPLTLASEKQTMPVDARLPGHLESSDLRPPLLSRWPPF